MAEYRIDDLARTAGTSVRNVRVYQDRGLLPPPERRGRTAVYSDAHLDRLRMVLSLLEKGYGFAQIRDIIGAWESGTELGDLLGLDKALRTPWTDETEQVFTLTELRKLFGRQATPGIIDRSLKEGLLVRRGARFAAPSPRLLKAGAELVAIGIPLAQVLDLAAQVRRHLDEVARLFVGITNEQLTGSHGEDWMPTSQEATELTMLVERLRPLAQMAVESILAQAMTREVDATVDEWVGRMVASRT